MDDFIKQARAFVHAVRRHRRTASRMPRTFMGWAEIGAGYYSKVYRHPRFPGLVVKISGPCGWGYDTLDTTTRYFADGDGRPDAWQVYARHCRDNPHPNLPKILHYEQVSQHLAFAVMPEYERAEGRFESWRSSVANELSGEKPCRDWLVPIYTMAQGLGFTLDLHGGNVMIDQESGEPVVTDPFSTVGDS